jgi:integrase
MLSDAVTSYVQLRRATGFRFLDQGRMLNGFAAFAEARGDVVVRTATALEWAALGSSQPRRHKRLLMVRSFALAAKAEVHRHEVPPADAFGARKFKRPIPHIYTPDEIARLIQAAARLGPKGSIRPIMYATLFGLLAATGLRVSEALALKFSDITEDGLIIRNTKFKKSRLVPLHGTVRHALDRYASVRNLHKPDDALFISTSSRVQGYDGVNLTFLQLARAIGLRGSSGQRGPRIHDLRHTFAVRSLEQCGRDRDDVARHMIALSTYLGHTHIRHTYWYLEATPLLMKQIAEANEALCLGDAP